MNSYFKNLFEYDIYANNLIIDAMTRFKHAGKGVNMMAHTLQAQQIWLIRCKQLDVNIGAVWPEVPLQDLSLLSKQAGQNWLNFIVQLSSDDFTKIIHYKNSRGEAFQNQLQDIIAHVINHGTHHRAQIGMLLKQDGYGTLPVTDYILYVRGRESDELL